MQMYNIYTYTYMYSYTVYTAQTEALTKMTNKWRAQKWILN